MPEITLSFEARMRPSARVSPLLALFVGVLAASPAQASAPDEQPRAQAEELARDGNLAEAAALWARLAREADDPSERAVAAFRGYQLWIRAHAHEGDREHLVAARSLLAELVVADGTPTEIVAEAEERISELNAALSSTPDVERALVEDEDATSEASDTGRPRSTADLLPVGTSALTPDDSPTVPTDGVRPLRIAGAVSLGLGASLLGVMSYGLIIDGRAAEAILAYDAKQEAGTLTSSDWARIDDLAEDGRMGSKLAIASGVSGGVALLTGAALLLTARRRHHKALALSPIATRNVAGLTLTGRF